jgi:hypothetical protein
MNIELLYDKECIICLDNKEVDWLTLECRHEYHKKCIHDWMRIRMICPICIRAIHLPHEDTQIIIHPPEDAPPPFYERRQRETAHILCSILVIAIICIILGTIMYVYA